MRIASTHHPYLTITCSHYSATLLRLCTFVHYLPPPEAIKDEASKLFQKWQIPVEVHKEGKKVLQEKWPGGGTVKYLMNGGNGKCPGYAQVGAELTHLLATYLLAAKNAATAAAAEAAAAEVEAERAAEEAGERLREAERTQAAADAVGANVFARPKKGSKKQGTAGAMPLHTGGSSTAAAGRAQSTAAPAPDPAPQPEYETVPLECEGMYCTPEQASAIKQMYGPYLGQRVISILISFDVTLVAWDTAYTKLPYPTPLKVREAHALRWFLDWGDFTEALGRVSNSDYKSVVPHRILHKGTKQIAEDGDLWCKSTAALEANQAELGRTLDKVTCRRVSCDAGTGETTKRQRRVKPESDSGSDMSEAEVEPEVVTESFSCSKGMAYTGMQHFIAAQGFRMDEENRLHMREDDALVLGPDARATSKRRLPKPLPADTRGSVPRFIELMRALPPAP